MVWSISLREQVTCHNRFAILSQPDEDEDELIALNDMFFDWDELENRWNEMNEPWELHDFSFMGRFSWSDESEKTGVAQHVYQHEHVNSMSRSSKGMREVKKHAVVRDKKAACSEPMPQIMPAPIRDEGLRQRLHESILSMQLTRHSQYHAIRSIMRKAFKTHAKKERRLKRQHEQLKTSAFFDWDELDAAEDNELSKRSNSWFDWDELSSAEAISKASMGKACKCACDEHEKAEREYWRSMMRMRGGGDESQHEQEQENEETAIVLDDEDKALCQTPVAQKEADESMSPPTDRVKRQLSFGSASSAESKQSRLHKFFRSPSSFSDDSSIHETPSPPPKRPRNRMEDTLREMLKSGQLSLDGKKLTLTAHEDVMPKLQQEVGKKSGRFGGRPMKPVSERRGIMGGQKSNRRKANEKPRQFELSVSMKNRICQQIYETRGHHPAEQDMLKAFAKKSKMRLDKLQDIWANRSTWAHVEKKDYGNMIGGEHSKQRPRMRAEGAVAKRQFPEVVQKLGHWLDKERAHGHQVLQRHLAWQYELLLQEHMVELTELLESEKSKDMSTEERQQHEVKLKLAEKQIEAMHGSEKLMNKRAKTLATWLGAETRVPNLVTQISSVEQQVRAELSWQHHDWCIHKVASADEDFMRQYFARPNEITPAIRKACVLGFSDQVPLWLKSGSKKEIMASWEVAGLKKKKQHPHLHEPQQTADETHPAAEEPHEESKAEEPHEESKAEEHHEKQPHEQEEPGDEWKLAMPDEKHEMAHLTTRRQEKADRYRVTFEAMQLVSGFFDHEKTPEGHCMRGILIVPGQHARLDNIDEHGKWKEDETFFYMGQERRHIRGESCGRALISWRKLRDEMPQAFRHFSVMSQPASNSDGICLPWVIKDQARQFPLSVWMRDAYGPAFTSDTVKTLFMGHQVQSSIMPKMTSALQLTDTDFSHAFKASVRRAIDEQSMRQAARRNEEDGHHEQQFPKMGIKEMALAIDAAMEHMIQMNEKTEWVLAGLRRNGFLALRPDEHGKMRKCDHEAWAKDKPLGCKRIHPTWVANRYQHENNGDIEKPNWARIEGATELSDLAHWHYNDGFKDAPSWEDIPFDEHSEPEWQACAKFQMPLDLRRAMLAREATMSDQAKEKRERRREKNKTRRQKKQQEHQLTDEVREELRASMQETSRLLALPTCPKPP
ncbi:Bbs2 [Symbiodinium sp. CCMP2592]|nr:Bbs2 [Symbiodinium sp. CCMP2592]